MNNTLKAKNQKRQGRRDRIRAKVRGTAERPRVTVYFSNKSVFAQMIDDDAGRTLISVTTGGKEAAVRGKTMTAAKWAGEKLAEKALGMGVNKAVFDRNGYIYHGRVKELAGAIREKGISL
ncbi:MAG: 50S ribosomal protein L18 [Nitrospinae bacterium]|nr:50S ribosomal protein L18 [Nitrospinota bacterium]